MGTSWKMRTTKKNEDNLKTKDNLTDEENKDEDVSTEQKASTNSMIISVYLLNKPGRGQIDCIGNWQKLYWDICNNSDRYIQTHIL